MKNKIKHRETFRIKVIDNISKDVIRNRQVGYLNKSFYSKSLVKIINQKFAILDNYTYICIS